MIDLNVKHSSLLRSVGNNNSLQSRLGIHDNIGKVNVIILNRKSLMLFDICLNGNNSKRLWVLYIHKRQCFMKFAR
ncbi:hypothetical protein D3C80_2104930 [compost metagenome]